MSFFEELKRRNVIRMALLYALAAWLIMQVAEVLIGLAKLPEWLGLAILGLLAIGFPIALILAWFYEITPDGLSRETGDNQEGSIAQVTGQRLNFIVIALLSAAVILFAYDKWWTSGPSQQSIAVLAFENMSGDPDYEYFSDGISEELLNLLAQIPDLRVISRSSAFSYKGKQVDVPTIGAQLNVAHVLEGSVRRMGDRVRITAQLIDARSDTHLWSHTYDRTLDDIFATQDNIASVVVEQLKVELLGEAPTVQATDAEAYALMLQARYLSRQFSAKALDKSIDLFRQALVIDPGYVPAWAGLAAGYIRQADQGLRPVEEGYALARDAADTALGIDPTSIEAYNRLARIAMNYDRDVAAAAQYYERALSIEPTNIITLSNTATLATFLGRLEQAIPLMEYVVDRDPVSPIGHTTLGLFYLNAGRLDDAMESFGTTLSLSPRYSGAHYLMATALLLKQEPQAALEELQQERSTVWRLIGLTMAHHALGQMDEADASLAELIEKYSRDAAYNIAYVMAFRGEADKAFEWLDVAIETNDTGLSNIAIQALFSNIHSDPRWLPFLESIDMSPAQLEAIELDVTLPADP